MAVSQITPNSIYCLFTESSYSPLLIIFRTEINHMMLHGLEALMFQMVWKCSINKLEAWCSLAEDLLWHHGSLNHTRTLKTVKAALNVCNHKSLHHWALTALKQCSKKAVARVTAQWQDVGDTCVLPHGLAVCSLCNGESFLEYCRMVCWIDLE
jgi:hypothetical protein